MKFGKLTMPTGDCDDLAATTVYGWLIEEGLLEAFATNPYACGTSEGQIGKLHSIADGVEEITQAAFNCAFLMTVSEEGEALEKYKTATLGQLMTKYPWEDEL